MIFEHWPSPLGGSLVLVGNLPYNIASILLIRLLSVVDCIDRAVFMLQREVAQRLAAAPGSRDYGRLTVMIGRVCTSKACSTSIRHHFHRFPRLNRR
ncbi:MAG: hypothetical protein Ct9H300mP14_09390 [Gammaproteobacteria bacterium]|nr:MAG: hypothetical protein Ct9H300mP14_09390 [Gammaproteobacteria bacterium]